MFAPRFDDRSVKGLTYDPTVEQPAPLHGGRLHMLWQSLPETERYSFVAWALSEQAADSLQTYQAALHELARRKQGVE